MRAAVGGRSIEVDGAAAGWGSRGRDDRGEGVGHVTENQRRAQDSLSPRELMLRGASAIALIATVLAVLLAIQPA